jgi:hypothetical protein
MLASLWTNMVKYCGTNMPPTQEQVGTAMSYTAGIECKALSLMMQPMSHG